MLTAAFMKLYVKLFCLANCEVIVLVIVVHKEKLQV
jgi:hypothetical protein